MNVTITKHVIVKFIELAAVSVLVSLLCHSSIGIEFEDAFLSSGTFFGYLIILVGLLLGGMLGTPVDIKVDLFYSFVGCVFFIYVGLVFVQEPYRSISKKEKIKGYSSIFTGVIFFADAISVILQQMK